jgi:hypothetical protein
MQEIIIKEGFRMHGIFYSASKKPQPVPEKVAVAAIGSGLAAAVPEQKTLPTAPKNKELRQLLQNKAKQKAPENK